MAAAAGAAASLSPTAAVAPSRSAEHAADWETLWNLDGGLKPGQRFDVSGSHAVLRGMVAAGAFDAARRVLVPGCGRGYDVVTLASATRLAVGLEYSHTAAGVAAAYVAENASSAGANARVVEGDFFSFADAGGPFDAVYDYTFFCALPPARRGEWAATMHRLLAPGGKLVTMQFPIVMLPPGTPEDPARGPPFLSKPADYDAVLLPLGFTVESAVEVPADQSPPGRVGAERCVVWVRPA